MTRRRGYTLPEDEPDARQHKRIAFLNDVLRRSLGVIGGRMVMTRSVAMLSDDERLAILRALATFDDFDEDNDPHGEHDCARFTAAGHACLFRVDYYDNDMRYASDDPADEAQTKRVLTLMLAEDY